MTTILQKRQDGMPTTSVSQSRQGGTASLKKQAVFYCSHSIFSAYKYVG